MESDSADFTHNFPPFFRIHSSGLVDRYLDHDFLPPSTDPQTGVVSRDAVVSPENNLVVRLYLPPKTTQLPLFIYIHGGGFSIESAFSSVYHPYANSLAAATKSMVVSIEYRLAPEHPIPTCYHDSYQAVKWIGSHSRTGSGPEPWLNEHADFSRVYIGGDSAGANIAHDIVDRSTNSHDLGFKFTGLVLIHPFFGVQGKPDHLWNYICPDRSGDNEFRLNPTTDLGRLSNLGCDRVLVCVAEKDFLVNRGRNYCKALKKSGWKGVAEVLESGGEQHVFHLFNPSCENASSMMNRIAEWLNEGGSAMSRF